LILTFTPHRNRNLKMSVCAEPSAEYQVIHERISLVHSPPPLSIHDWKLNSSNYPMPILF